jgi:WD40 repeat protein
LAVVVGHVEILRGSQEQVFGLLGTFSPSFMVIMKRLFPVSGCLILVSLFAGKAWSEEPEKRSESRGPLERFDPCPENLPCLLAVHGTPRLGLPASMGYGLQRLGTGDKWCVEMNNNLGIVELDPKSGEMKMQEAIKAVPEWCLSPDGKRLFARREQGFKESMECFDFASGKSLWTFEAGRFVSDATFTPDGKQIVVLHTLDGQGIKRSPAVSWYDAETGERTRRVKLPGILYQISGAISTDYLGLTEKAVYVAIPRDGEAPEAWVIRSDSDEPAKLDLDMEDVSDLTQIRVGGEHRELVAFYNDYFVALFREENGGLTLLYKTDISPTRGDGSYPKNVRFSHDHSRMVVSSYDGTRLMATVASANPVLKTFKSGLPVGDYTADGKFFVSFDDGGGVLRDLDTWERSDRLKLREFPAHCCPIQDAGFSMNGQYILSNDKHKLILWSKEGEFLAELASPNEEAKTCLEMQSPIFVDRLNKVYAADGWDFLEWDLNEVTERRKRLPGINPKVIGKTVYRDRVNSRDEPETMNIGIDSTGKNLLTATRTTFLFRPLDEPEKKTKLLVPMNDIFMKPRSLYMGGADSKVLVRTGFETFELDPTGKEKEVYLNQDAAGFDPQAKKFFRAVKSKQGLLLAALPPGLKAEAQETMPLPDEWKEHRLSSILVSSDGRWLLASHEASGSMPSLAVSDWVNKKVVRDIPLSWRVTSLAFSRDESRLLVGSFNRSVYEFDFKKMCGTAD